MYSNYMLGNPQYGVGYLSPIAAGPLSLSTNYGPASLPPRMQPNIDDSYLNYLEGASQYADAVEGLATKGSLIGSLIGFGSKLVNDTINFNRQYELQSRQNAWNSPQEQMQRMIAAGINPNAAAQGIAGAPNVGSPASFTPGQNSMPDLASLLGNSVNTDLDANVLRATEANIKADTKNKESVTVGQNISNAWANQEHAANLRKAEAEGWFTEETAKIVAADAKYADANAFAKWQTTCENLRKIANEADVLAQAYYTEMAKTYATMMAGDLSAAQIRKVFSDIGVNNATIRLIEKQVDNVQADTLLKGQEMKESEARTTAQNIQNKFQQDYYDIWQNAGWDMNSNVDANIYRMLMNGETENYKRFFNGMNVYFGEQNNASMRGARPRFEGYMDIFKTIVSILPLGNPPANNYTIVAGKK